MRFGESVHLWFRLVCRFTFISKCVSLQPLEGQRLNVDGSVRSGSGLTELSERVKTSRICFSDAIYALRSIHTRPPQQILTMDIITIYRTCVNNLGTTLQITKKLKKNVVKLRSNVADSLSQRKGIIFLVLKVLELILDLLA